MLRSRIAAAGLTVGALLAFGAAAVGPFERGEAGIDFVNVRAAPRKCPIETRSAGGGFFDYDLDGDLDGYLVTNRRAGDPPPPADVQVKATFNKGELSIEEQYREKYDVVLNMEVVEKYRVG